MKLFEWLEKWQLSSLKINAKFLELEFEFSQKDKLAAWEMYVELLTRITTQPLDNHSGLEKSALSSVYSLFGVTREILKKHGYKCYKFAQIAILILNQKIRPFTAKWHKLSEEGAFQKSEVRQEFREELKELQADLNNYNNMLRKLIGIEDPSILEIDEDSFEN